MMTIAATGRKGKAKAKAKAWRKPLIITIMLYLAFFTRPPTPTSK